MSCRDEPLARGAVRLFDGERSAARSELGRLLSTIELKNFLVPARISAREGLGDRRRAGRPGHRRADDRAGSSYCNLSVVPEAARLDFLASCVRHALRDALAHEVDEALHVAGVRVFDPHRGER